MIYELGTQFTNVVDSQKVLDCFEKVSQQFATSASGEESKSLSYDYTYGKKYFVL